MVIVKIKFTHYNQQCKLFKFMQEIINNLNKMDRIRTSETYTSALKSFSGFLQQQDIPLDSINSGLIQEYEAYLKRRGVSLNTSSFYMRILRAVYNRAVDMEMVLQRYPFKHVYTGVEKTAKRAVTMSVIKRIKELDLKSSPALELSRDMFMFSFYTRGMSFVDMAYLRKDNLNLGILSYRRRKTGQKLIIKWEKPMQEIVDKYAGSTTDYLLPIITDKHIDERMQYIYARHNINYNLKIIGNKLGLNLPLTTYVARHTWASIARSKNIPLSVISECMGHDSEKTTRIYLTSLNTSAIDKANKLILKLL